MTHMTTGGSDPVTRALDHLERHPEGAPDLATLAARVGLSPFHFQRLFKARVGVSPKRYLQHRAAARAAELLADHSVLDSALAAGLSGPGRLHDLFVTVEAMTPGEFRREGEGLEIGYGVHDTPFGRSLLAHTGRGICALEFLDDEGEARERLRRAFPRARLRADERHTGSLCERIFAGGGELCLHVRGTNFQIQVWRALLAVPCGETTSYSELAQRIGRPRAARAVGAAVGSNPVSVLIPCHRVLRRDGSLGGYRWGLKRKQALLHWESGPDRRSRWRRSAALPASSIARR